MWCRRSTWFRVPNANTIRTSWEEGVCRKIYSKTKLAFAQTTGSNEHPPRVESAHMVITLHSSIHDRSITLFSDTLFGNFMVHPVRVTPHGAIDLAKFHRGAGVVFDGFLEHIIKVAVIQKDIRIIKPPVKVPLNRLERLNNTIQLLIPGQNDERSVCSWPIRFHWKTARGEDFVVFFTYFPV